MNKSKESFLKTLIPDIRHSVYLIALAKTATKIIFFIDNIILTLLMSLQLMNHMSKKSSLQIVTCARHAYGQVGVFGIKMKHLVQKV